MGIWKEIYKDASHLKMNSSLEWKRGKILGICLVYSRTPWCVVPHILCDGWVNRGKYEGGLDSFNGGRGGGGGWNLCFKRPINDWDMERVEGLIIVIKDKKINPPKRT